MDELADDTIRSFVAVELPDRVKADIAEIQKRLQAHEATRIVRWAEPALTHITLEFLGEVEVLKLPYVKDTLDLVVDDFSAFTVETGLLGAFPNVYRPRVLWLGVEDEEGYFDRLKPAVRQALESFGDAKRRHGDFIPHVTIGRVNRRAAARKRKELGALIGPTEIPTGRSFDVHGLALFRSRLTPSGPEYTRLSFHAFGHATDAQDEGPPASQENRPT